MGMPLAAQSLWLPASDPVGIARSGAGVAFGQSLEAAALNPALLVTLREGTSAFVAAGMELQSSQGTLGSNSNVNFSTDRNRFLPALGAAWRLSQDVTLGIKVDNPFMRHALFDSAYAGRFEALGMDLTTHRFEVQGAWSITPGWSVGASVGVTRVQYGFRNSVRVPVPANPLAAQSASNPTQGLLEVVAMEEGTKTLPSYALGFRWAINPRWTVAGAWQGSIQGTLGMKSKILTDAQRLVGVDGVGSPDVPAVTNAPIVLGQLTSGTGDGTLTLPGRATVGVRQRLNQTFTWEFDLRYVQGASTRIPGYPTVTGPSGTVTGGGMPGKFHSGYGFSLAGEMVLTKRLTGRMGVAMDPGLREDPSLEPTLGGARSASFSFGLGWRALGGEFNLGWQIRQAQDREVPTLDGRWDQNGYTTMNTLTRVEGMGHLWSLGFKKAF